MINKFIAYINKGQSRSIDAKKNIVASFVIKGINILINLALVPLTIKYINSTQYGIWLTLSSIITWFSFFDIGFGNGLRNRFTEAKATGDLEKARIYVSTTYIILTLVFAVVWMFFFVVNFFINWNKILHTQHDMAGELSKLALIVFSFFCLQIVLKTINTVIIADQKPAKAAFFDTLALLIVLVVIFILTKTTNGSLIYLGIAMGFTPIIILLISSIWFYSKQYKYVAPSLKLFKLDYAKDIFKLGFKFFIIQIAAVVIYQTNNIIIAQVGSPEDVTIFNIAYKYLGVVLMVLSIVLSPFWSAFTDANTKKDYSWMRTTVKTLRSISYLLIIIVIILILGSKYFYKLWIGNIVTIPLPVTISVGVYITLICIVFLNTQILNGIGKIKIQLLTYSLAMIFHIPLAVFLGARLGIVGVALSASFFCSIISVYAIIQVNLLINNKAKGIWNA